VNLTLRQLKVFDAVARHGSYTRAARELHLSQPAVSMQVRQLEEAAGLGLFEQVGRRIFLTEAGEAMQQAARAIRDQLDSLDEQLQQLRGMSGGRLTVSVATTAHYFIADLLAVFAERHPGVVIRLDVTNRASLLRALADNVADMVVMGQPPAESDLEAGAFMDNPLVVVAPPAHALAGQRRIPLERLQDEVFLVREPGSGTRSAMERFFDQHGIHLKTGMEVGSNEAIKQSVRAGLGLGLLARDTVAQELGLKQLVELDVEQFPILRHWYVVHRRGKHLSPAAAAFKEFLLGEASYLIRGREGPGARERQPAAVDPATRD